MNKAKETMQKVAHPTSGSTDVHAPSSGLERDMHPKPTKVHLQDQFDVSTYSASGKLAGKRAVITGGDSGIGRAVAILFAMEGARLAIVYLPSEEADAQHTKAQVEKNGGEILLLASDLSHPVNCKDVVEQAARSLGGIDILVNNAAKRHDVNTIESITDDMWCSTLRTNVDSYFFVTKAAMPHMQEGGIVINSASVDSYIGVPDRVDYATSKGAVVAFTRALSNQLLKSKRIRVNAVAAGPVWTPLMATGSSGSAHEGHGLGNWTPMGRQGQPAEIATSYVFLAGKDSAFMSGQTLHPNGGIVVAG